MASETERAWTAGMIDGDGCITFVRKGKSVTSSNPILVVDNTDMEILKELQRLYGGSLVIKKSQSTHHRQAWSWRMYGADKIIAMLSEVVPYMKCDAKIGRARMILDEYKLVTPRNGHYTDELLEQKINWQDRFRAIGSGRGSQNQSSRPPQEAWTAVSTA